MIKLPFLSACIALGVFSSCPIARGQAALESQPTPKEVEEFAATILPYAVGDEFHKWAASPSISCFGEAVKYKPVVEQFVADMTTILNGLPIKPELIADNSPKADILFVIDSPKALAVLRRQEKAQSTWQWQASWNPDKSLKRFTTYTDASGFKDVTGKSERRMIYQLLLRCMGISGEKMYPVVSIWGKFNEGNESSAIWELDRKLIRFAYEFVPSGASKNDIRKLVRKNWH